MFIVSDIYLISNLISPKKKGSRSYLLKILFQFIDLCLITLLRNLTNINLVVKYFFERIKVGLLGMHILAEWAGLELGNYREIVIKSLPLITYEIYLPAEHVGLEPSGSITV